MSEKKYTDSGMTFKRRFTTENNMFPGVNWVRRDSRIGNPDGSLVFELDNIEVPDFWEQMAIDILASKYLRKTGVPQFDLDDNQVLGNDLQPVLGPERSVRQWALRLANAWRIWGERYGYFKTAKDAEIFRDEIAYALVHQMASPNSPQHFNTGLYEAYGIVQDSTGMWYADPETGELRQSQHRYERSAASACFILGLEDKLVGEHSIFDSLQDQARLFQGGSGVGMDASVLRGKNELLSGGGRSSGMMSFIKVIDRGAGSVKSGGTTRRAAIMLIARDDHPEIMEFAQAKAREEDKIAALVRAGWDASWNAEDGAVDSAFYQNFNASVMLSKKFLDKVAVDGDWDLIGRTDGKVMKTIKARDLWDAIADAAWRCADPGVMFADTINDWNTCKEDGEIRASNPCAEYLHLDDTACNLASLNLVKFYDDERRVFKTDDYRHVVRLFETVLEITVTMAHYPTSSVAERSAEYRTTGLGYCNLGAMLMRAGLAYDSDEGRAVMGAVTSLMNLDAWKTSAELSRAVGVAPAYPRNKKHVKRVLRNHVRAGYGTDIEESGLGPYEKLSVEPAGLNHRILSSTQFEELGQIVKEAGNELLELVDKYGVRNTFTTCLAPTGTIGLQMDADTTGVEPSYSLVIGKKLAGGGYMKIVNGSVEPALKALGYTSSQREAIIEYALGTGHLNAVAAVNRRSLTAKGLSSDAIDRIENALIDSFDLEFAVTPWTVGAETMAELKVLPDEYNEPGFSLLRFLGFTDTEIEESSKVICGHQTLEGAPYLLDEHLSVFDCANYCGDGTRVIDWTGHVKALGAVAPFLSGSSSKTINMPNDATVDDIKDAYELTRKLSVKNCAVYRDGSKGSQVLSSGSLKDSNSDEAPEPIRIVEQVMVRGEDIPLGLSPTAFYQDSNPPRFRLPNMRGGVTWRIDIGGDEVYIRTGEYPGDPDQGGGTIGELFIDWGKQGSTLRGVTSALAIMISQALQHGVPLDRIINALKGHTFEPRGVVQGHDNLKMANSVVDAVIRVIGYYYTGREDLVQAEGGPVSPSVGAVIAREPGSLEPVDVRIDTQVVATPVHALPAVHEPGEPGKPVTVGAEKLSKTRKTGTAVYGKTCSSCGSSDMIQSGTCMVCRSCGSTTGCS